MLVLTRKSLEQVIIGNSVVTLLSINGGHVRLGFEFPEDVPIHRAEDYEWRVTAIHATAGNPSATFQSKPKADSYADHLADYRFENIEVTPVRKGGEK